MRNLLCACALFLSLVPAFSQSGKIKAEKYPSLLWEITGKGLSKPSYLFGTMHVSSKMVFHLSDSFYLGIRRAQIVALETNPGTWQEDFSRYDLEGESFRRNPGRYAGDNADYTIAGPQDYLTISTLKLSSFEKDLEAALYSSPSILNSFLYRSNSEMSSDFEEDTYLDLHIFQTGRKLGKKICGVEDFHGSMQLVKEAYQDAAKEKKKKRNYDYDEEFSYGRMEEAYRTGNLDLLDTINKVNSQSAAFDEKFLYKRNDIQAASIDSIIRTGASLFVGVGAAHLPGQRGVIEILRRLGYRLRPIKMNERDSHHKENIEKIRVPVQFARQTAEDGFYSVMVPGKLYSFGKTTGTIEMKQFADMTNGSYYMVTRIATNAAIQGQSALQVQRKLDSVLYENIPGRILQKTAIVRNGYHGYDITNRTRRGDMQRYQIFITPFEVLIFKISGNGDYVGVGTEATRFFSSIQLKEYKPAWEKWSPAYGGFEVELPHQPLVFSGGSRVYTAFDAVNKTAFEVIRTDIHNYDFLEEDSFDLALMEESFASSESIARNLSKQWLTMNGYPTLEARYRFKDSSVAVVRFLIQGPHYYTVMATAKEENRWTDRFLQSFVIRPFTYGEARRLTDTVLKFSVSSPVALEQSSKLPMYPNEAYYSEEREVDDSLVDNGTFKTRIVENDSTGEKISIKFYKHSPYFFYDGKQEKKDSAVFKKEWTIRHLVKDTLQNGLVMTACELGNRKSSRFLKVKTFLKDGMGYKLETALDTLSKNSAFITAFFESFTPLDALAEFDIRKKKSTLFFEQFFSADTQAHKKVVKNLGIIVMDSTDFPALQKAIQSLFWNEKAYLQVKKELIGKMASIPTRPAAAYLKTLYYAAGDTLELQYAALEALLSQRTADAYQTFAGIMQNDPPVLDPASNNRDDSFPLYRYGFKNNSGFHTPPQNGSFFDNLTDSLSLTAGIFRDLLPLITIADYEQPVMELLGILVDSALIQPTDYEAYLPKFILEAKQTLKKQLIREKAKAIEKAQKEVEEKKNDGYYEREEDGAGNERLSLYATLMLPFRDKNLQVEAVLKQLLASSDKRLKYNTMLLLLRNDHSVHDSLLLMFASLDEFRFELYNDLKNLEKEELFPAAYRSQMLLAKSQLLGWQAYGRPDTLVYLQKLPVSYKEKEGFVYFFKYKEKKEENTWKIGSAGLFPKDSSELVFELSDENDWDEKNDFTELTTTRLVSVQPETGQLEQLRKKMLYSRRKSGARFYEEENMYRD